MRKVGSQGNISSPASSSKTEASSSSSAAAAAAAAAATPSSSSSSSSSAASAAAPSPAPLTQEQIAKQKASKQLSKQMAVMDLKSRLNKDASRDLKGDMARKAGNLGVYADAAATKTGHAAAAAGGLLSASAGALADKVLHGGNTMKAIKDSYGKEVAADFKAAKKDTQAQLEELNKKQQKAGGRLPDVNDREKLARLEILSKSFESEPMTIARAISQNRTDPAYKIMGSSHFVSMEVLTRKKLEAAGKGDYGLSIMERVAIYGYTTKDYTVINPALRAARGSVSADPQISSYVNHITNGLSKLPDYEPGADKAKVFRGMVGADLPQFVKDQLRVGGELRDFAFSSTSTDKVAAQMAGDYQLEISNFAGKGAKLLPFSAFEGEGEVLFPPGTRFKLTGQDAYNPKRFHVDVQ